MRTSVTAVAFIVWIVLAATPAQSQVAYAGFGTHPRLSLVGDAQVLGDTLRLTPGRANSVGAAWHGDMQHIGEGFITRFTFRISEPGGESDGVANGGDGIAFVIQHSDSGDTAIGFYGGQIGYGGIARSLAVEFDMWRNDFRSNADPSHNHISVHTRGFGRNSSDHGYSLGMTSEIPDLGDGYMHDVVIRYVEKKLSIFIDDCTAPMLEVNVDIAARLGLDSGRAWLGFTAGTASAWENHDILSWSVSGIGVVPSGTAAMCEGDSLVLTVPTLHGECLWSTGATGRSITVREPGRYKVTVTDTMGCRSITYIRSVDVTVAPSPDPVITMDRPPVLCPGETLMLDAGPGYESYRWSNGARTQRIAVTTDGSYAVRVTNAAGCATTSEPVHVEMRIPPAPSITANRSLVICPGDSVTLDAGEGYDGYRWSNGARTRTITVRTGGEYSVEVTDRYGCSGASAAVQVSVGTELRPVITVQGPTEFCDGEGVLLDAGPDYAGYQWSTGATSRTIRADRPGSYTVTVVAKGGCRGTSAPVEIIVHPRPLPSIEPDRPPVICDGQKITLDAGDGYQNYAWSNGETGRTITVDRPGRYTVTVTTAAGCTGAATIDLSEGSMTPPAITPGGAVTLCGGDSIVLDAGAGYAAYLWSNGATERTITVRDSGVFQVIVTNAAGCTATSAAVTVALHQAPSPLIQPDGPLNFCTGGSVMLHAPAGYAGYRWSTGATTPEIVVTTSGVYTVSVTDGAGCTGTSPAVEVVAGASLSPKVTVLGPPVVCVGDSVLLEAPAGYTAYHWSSGETTRRIIVRQSGSYQVTVEAGGGCSGTSAPVTILVRPGPPEPVIIENAAGLLTDPAAAYQWYLDGEPIAGANGRSHAPAQFGIYHVVVTDESGCTARSATYPYFDARSSVSLPSITAAPGSTILVPLRLDSSHDLDSRRAGDFRVVIRFDGALLIPGGITSCCGAVHDVAITSDGRDRLLAFEASRPPGLSSGDLAHIAFHVAVGPVDATPLRLESFEWPDAGVRVLKTDGAVGLDDLCFSGGRRLVNASGVLALKPVRPNPVSGRAEVEFEIVEDGDTEVVLADALGRRVLAVAEGNLRAGHYLIPIDVAPLPAGLYFCVLRTPTARLSTSVHVVR